MNDISHDLLEGVHDPHIFKAVFMAGAPGSGKSTVRQQLFGGTGLKLTDADEVRRAYLHMGKPGDYNIYDRVAQKQQLSYTEQRLGIIMDRTAWWAPSIRNTTHELRSLGYDVAMVHVWAPLDVSLQRVATRATLTGRQVPEHEVIKRYQGLSENIRDYAELFGDQFWFVDNSRDHAQVRLVKSQITQWLHTPTQTPQAMAWKKAQGVHLQENAHMKSKSTKKTSAGVIITDGTHVLLGHTTNSQRWDIPKGGVDQGETALEAAVRELAEETGLRITPDKLQYLGRHSYSDRKDLELFLWKVVQMPDPHMLHCVSEFYNEQEGAWQPELDAFQVVPWSDADHMVGKNLRRVMRHIQNQI